MRLGIWVWLMAVSVTASAQTTQPAPTATRPARVEPAASTPKETLRSLNLALRDGDADTIQFLFLTSDEHSARLIGAMADYSAALVSLHQAAKGTFGQEGANRVTGDLNAQSVEGLAAIEKADVRIEGNLAVVKFGGATDPPVTLVKVNGRWRVPLSQLLDGADRSAEERRLIELNHQAELARKTAQEISSGKFREGPAKAAEVWRSRLLEPSNIPTTRPHG